MMICLFGNQARSRAETVRYVQTRDAHSLSARCRESHCGHFMRTTDPLVGLPRRGLGLDGRRAVVTTSTNRTTGKSCNRVMCIPAEIAKGSTRLSLALRTT